MTRQNQTGKATEALVFQRLQALGLEATKPRVDVGVDLEVWHPAAPDKKLGLQVKGRGAQQKNKRYRWFQIRTTEKQRQETKKTGLPVAQAWRKKVALCEFFVLVSLKHEECWVLPQEKVGEIILLNVPKYGRRSDNISGEHAEMDLDIEHEGRPLTELYAGYRENFRLIVEELADGE